MQLFLQNLSILGQKGGTIRVGTNYLGWCWFLVVGEKKNFSHIVPRLTYLGQLPEQWGGGGFWPKNVPCQPCHGGGG